MTGRKVAALLVAGVVVCATLGIALSACGSDTQGEPKATKTSTVATQVDVAGVTVTADPKLHDLLPDDIVSAEVIRVASNMPYPPWEMYEDVNTKTPTGIDHDLALALATKLGVDMSFDQTVFDSIIPALLANKEDIVMAGMWDSKDRQQELDFIDYATDGYGLLVVAGNPLGVETVDDLAGVRVAVQSGTSQLDELKKLNKEWSSSGKAEIEILTFPQDSDALLALKSGKADVQMDGVGVAAYSVKTFDDGATFQLIDDPSVYEQFGSGIVGIGVPKTKQQLRDALQAALQSLMDDGTYAAILAAYGAESIAVASAEINQGE